MRISDWSSDVCSSDLVGQPAPMLTDTPLSRAGSLPQGGGGGLRLAGNPVLAQPMGNRGMGGLQTAGALAGGGVVDVERSEQRRVGKECVRTLRDRGSPYD